MQGGAAEAHPRLEVDEECARDIMLIIGLIKENILAVAALGGPVFEDAFFVDTVLGTKPLPEDRPH